ncbi:MAG: HAMP domain-containing histidine kinase [Clostridia bacterium]|nr:HAMP domain-containing histidine kinase [Deltaproteobacteria bacterium]
MAENDQERAERAEEELARRDELYALVLHDLRNPLNTIGMSCALLFDDLPAPQKETVNRIRRAVDRMEKLMRDVSEVVRLEYGNVRLDLLPLRVGDLVRQALETHETKVATKRITVDVGAIDEELKVEVDRDRFVRALSGLIDNAVKFTPEAGRIAIEIRVMNTGMVEFAITDTGPGIPADDRSSLFERHRKINNKRGQGLSLGLAIIALTIQRLGGTIGVDPPSASGGSRFWVRVKEVRRQTD